MIPSVLPRELKAMPHIFLLDVRTKEEWEIARIPGAMLLPLPDVESHIEDVRKKAGGSLVVVYCHTGRRSAIATALLLEHGIDAKNLQGGIDAWSAIDPQVPRY